MNKALLKASEDIIKLEEENEKLRKELEELKNPNNYYQYASKLVKNNCENLQQRINRAIEYNNHLIKHAKYNLNVNHIKKSNKILKGSEE